MGFRRSYSCCCGGGSRRWEVDTFKKTKEIIDLNTSNNSISVILTFLIFFI